MTELSHISVLPIADSLWFINTYHPSVARFGDGEIDIMTGHSIPYQDYDENLAKELLDILEKPSSKRLLVCLPDVFHNMSRYNSSAQSFWQVHFSVYESFYKEHCHADWYGSTFISRPYIDLADKSQAAESFAQLKALWEDRDILIVEGETSRSGVGNDLFDNAKSISRIIGPSRNAYAKKDELLDSIRQHGKDKLVLLMMGPTAKVIAGQLAKEGTQAIDLGHIDSEYEWFQMKAQHKVKLSHKHTAEHNYDRDITLEDDPTYTTQIVATVGIAPLVTEPTADTTPQAEAPDTTEPLNNEIITEATEQAQIDAPTPLETEENTPMSNETISVIVPVYNVDKYLNRCLDSLLKQTYTDFEIILINDGSTDYSADICNEYAAKDSRIRVYHQDNAGVSAARNRALELVRGAYITFIDSDDFVEDIYLEHLHTSLVENGSDISAVNFTSFNEERQAFLFFTTPEGYYEKTFETQEWLDQETVAKDNLYMAYTFSPLKLFKKELFDGVRFPVGRLREDDATIYKLYLKAKKVTFRNEGIYYYSQRPEGLSRTSMLGDIASMISNAEERIALIASLGYDVSKHIGSYVARLRKCQADALHAGEIHLYEQITTKINLYEQFHKGEND